MEIKQFSVMTGLTSRRQNKTPRLFGRLINILPKDVHTLVPGACDVILPCKRRFAGVTEDLGLSVWVKCNQRVLIRERQEDQSQE